MPPDTPGRDLALELRGVSKFFGDLPALRELRLRVEPGDSILLYGPNGAGKTTLLRILATLARPTEGQVLFDGRDVHRNPQPARAALGFASHTSFLYGELTARENLRFVGTLFGLRDLEKRIDAAVELLGLTGRGNVRVRELSRGQQQRASLARAFLHSPRFLLLDEPFAGLDTEAVARLRDLLQQLPGQGKAVVFSTHDFEQGRAIARRMVALETGQMRYDGPLDMAPLEALGIHAGERRESAGRRW